LSSGSKKPRPRPAPKRRSESAPPELGAWQVAALDGIAASKLAAEVVFGGGAALAARHLHHRRSEDLDFFLVRELELGELRPVERNLKASGFQVEEQQVGPRRSLLLRQDGQLVGRIDFAYYPYDPIGRRERWRGLTVESLIDMTVNKVQAVLTRFRARDFVDLFFLLREGPERDLDRLLDLARAKFDSGYAQLSLAQRLLLVSDIVELPVMLRPVTREELVAFFESQSRAIVKQR
jgi:predicted nucleotidyltransferase component of viral defense system